MDNTDEKLGRETPACARCLKAGFKCAGYNLPLRVQEHIIGHNGDLVQVPGGVRNISRPQPPRPFSLVGFQEQIAFSFFFNSHRWAHFWRPLLQLIPEEENDSNYKASLAVALGYMAKITKSSDLVEQAIELNTYAVKEVRAALARRSKPDSARMLMTIVGALGIYNYTVDQKFHYVHHYGAQMIVKFCGPTYFQKEPYLTSFRHSRKMLYCLSLSFKCKTFLSEQIWKTVPFQLSSKTTEDKLFDILVDIPGLAEIITSLHRPPGEVVEVAEKLQSLRSKVIRWRGEWQLLNPQCATEAVKVSSRNMIFPPCLEEFLSTGILFQTAQQAVELLHYNSAMLYLSHLQYVLEGDSPSHRTMKSFTSHQAECLKKLSERQWSAPLLLPSEVEFQWQYGIEGLRILANIRHELSVSRGIYLVAAPIAILYCFSKYLDIKQGLLSMIGNEPWTEDEESGLARYEVTSVMASPLGSVGDPEYRSMGKLEPQNYETANFQDLFVKTSRASG
ncbi:hypothetical protein BP6252_13651 [Coleophoma cylindrospora]|uniref:Zn(2)-C6 fungal-type domain-containing protein n=1 Tax=Coleophoma cylindrospora TaxID=1849047 RepID=A0A3D8Q998_9HELO|nr:hypothetical protein BP6252_13651 [Coleophoma cylindrospora]